MPRLFLPEIEELAGRDPLTYEALRKIAKAIGENQILSGDGSPENQISAGPNTLYMRRDPKSGPRALYVKNEGFQATGWKQLWTLNEVQLPSGDINVPKENAGFDPADPGFQFGANPARARLRPPAGTQVFGWQNTGGFMDNQDFDAGTFRKRFDIANLRFGRLGTPTVPFHDFGAEFRHQGASPKRLLHNTVDGRRFGHRHSAGFFENFDDVAAAMRETFDIANLRRGILGTPGGSTPGELEVFGNGRVQIQGLAAEFAFKARDGLGQRFVVYNPDGSGRLFKDTVGDVEINTGTQKGLFGVPTGRLEVFGTGVLVKTAGVDALRNDRVADNFVKTLSIVDDAVTAAKRVTGVVNQDTPTNKIWNNWFQGDSGALTGQPAAPNTGFTLWLDNSNQGTTPSFNGQGELNTNPTTTSGGQNGVVQTFAFARIGFPGEDVAIQIQVKNKSATIPNGNFRIRLVALNGANAEIDTATARILDLAGSNFSQAYQTAVFRTTLPGTGDAANVARYSLKLLNLGSTNEAFRIRRVGLSRSVDIPRWDSTHAVERVSDPFGGGSGGGGAGGDPSGGSDCNAPLCL